MYASNLIYIYQLSIYLLTYLSLSLYVYTSTWSPSISIFIYFHQSMSVSIPVCTHTHLPDPSIYDSVLLVHTREIPSWLYDAGAVVLRKPTWPGSAAASSASWQAAKDSQPDARASLTQPGKWILTTAQGAWEADSSAAASTRMRLATSFLYLMAWQRTQLSCAWTP